MWTCIRCEDRIPNSLRETAEETADGPVCALCFFYEHADLDDLWFAACPQCGEIHLDECAAL